MAKRLLLGLSLLLLTLFIYATVLRPVLYPYWKLPALLSGQMNTLVLFMFSLTHAWYMLGWLLTTFTVYLIYRIFESMVRLRTLGQSARAFAVMPLLAYGAMMISMSLEANPRELGLIGLFAMGVPLACAFSRLFLPNRT